MGASESMPYQITLGEPYPTTNLVVNGLWTEIVPGISKPTINAAMRKVTVFVRNLKLNDLDEKSKMYFQKSIHCLKTIRHPNIVNFVMATNTPTELRVIVNRVRPLQIVLPDLDSLEVLSGLNEIRDALVFLHINAQRCHNNLSPSAIFVSEESGVWQLGSFECSRENKDTQCWINDEFVKRIHEQAFCPPEDLQQTEKNIPYFARDSYSFGKLIEYLIKHFEQILTVDHMTRIHDFVQRLIYANPVLRPPVTSIPEDLFTNDLTTICEFLDCLPQKNAKEREIFFSELPIRLLKIPTVIIKRRLIKRLLQRLVLVDEHAQNKFLPFFLSIRDDNDESIPGSGLMISDTFTTNVVPELMKIWRVRETSVRLVLCACFDKYAAAIPDNLLKRIVLNELAIGVKDSNDEIVAASFRGMATCVSILGASVVTGTQHRRIFSQAAPRDPLCTQPTTSELMQSVKAAMKQHNALKDCQYVDSSHFKEFRVVTPPIQNQKSTIDWNEVTDPDWCNDEFKTAVDAHLESNITSTDSATEETNNVASTAPMTPLLPRVTELGEEFNVIARVAPVEAIDEPDFFADMQPNIKPKICESPASTRTLLFDKEMAHASTPSKFAVIMSNNNGGTSWNEDDDLHIDD